MHVAGDVQTEREPQDLAGAEAVQRDLRRVALQEAEMLLQHLAQRPVRRPASVWQAAARPAKRAGRLVRKPLAELADEPGLADAGVAEDGHALRPAFAHRPPVCAAEALELLVAAHERLSEAAHAPSPRAGDGAYHASCH